MTPSRKQHIFEFWPYLTGKEPKEVKVTVKPDFYSLTDDFQSFAQSQEGLVEATMEDINPAINAAVTRVWQEGVERNPRMTSQLKPVLRRITTEEGIDAALSSYQNAYWMKLALSELPLEEQRKIANQLCFLNIGAVTITSDGYVLLEQRPDNVTAGGMLLNYPCGYLTRTDKTLEDPVNAQARGELGFPIVTEDGSLDERIRSIESIGMQRESDEWSTNYVFLVTLDIPLQKVKPTKETKKVIGWRLTEITNRAVEAYWPTIKGDASAIHGKLVPNTVGMLGLYIRGIQGEKAFNQFMDRIKKRAEELNYAMRVEQYTPQTNPFQ